MDVFTNQIELPRYSRMVPEAEIASAANDYNLNLPRYIDSSELEDLQDLDAHLNGGIPVRDIDALDAYWKVFPSVRQALFREAGRNGYREPRVPANRLKETILGHGEFQAFAEKAAAVFDAWRAAHQLALEGIQVDDLPRELIHTLSEDFLELYTDLPLLDSYNLYQRLMDYWAEVMQDDVYLIAADGWDGGRILREAYDKEAPDFSMKQGRKTLKYVGALIPTRLVVARYFSEQQAKVARLESKVTNSTERKTAFEEEHGGDEGALSGLEGSRGITKGNVQQRAMDLKQAILDTFDKNTPEHKQAKTIKKTTFGSGDWEFSVVDEDGLFEELDVLHEYLQIAAEESVQKKEHKEAGEKLHSVVLARYGELTEAELKTLVVEDKWLASLRAAVEGEVQRLTEQLAGRVKELDERYARTLPELERRVETLSGRVEAQLKKMGLAWDEQRIDAAH